LHSSYAQQDRSCVLQWAEHSATIVLLMLVGMITGAGS
jgi:hypothetical protein